LEYKGLLHNILQEAHKLSKQTPLIHSHTHRPINKNRTNRRWRRCAHNFPARCFHHKTRSDVAAATGEQEPFPVRATNQHRPSYVADHGCTSNATTITSFMLIIFRRDRVRLIMRLIRKSRRVDFGKLKITALHSIVRIEKYFP